MFVGDLPYVFDCFCFFWLLFEFHLFLGLYFNFCFVAFFPWWVVSMSCVCVHFPSRCVVRCCVFYSRRVSG